jgi:hypothetical protein
MKATQAIIMYDDENDDVVYAEHYDIINGNMVNAKPVTEDFFSSLKFTEKDTKLQAIPKEVLALSQTEILFFVEGRKREILLALNDKTIKGELEVPTLIFHVKKIEKKIYVYAYDDGKLYVPPFPNITDSKLCTGTFTDNFFNGDYDKIVRSVTSIFFDSRFSNHYDTEIFNAMKNAIETCNPKYYEREKLEQVSSDIQRFIPRLL